MLPTGQVIQMTVRMIIAVATGGAVGALARGGIVGDLGDHRSASLFVINVIGSFLLGLLVVRLADSPTALAAAGTGFCGALTSLSTFALDVAERLSDGQVGSAGLLVALTIGFAFAGALAGLRLGESE